MASLETWRDFLNEFDDEIIWWAPDEAAFDIEFDSGYGHAQGPDVLAWSRDYVYFPVTYDGLEWLARAPRKPQTDGQHHVGCE